MKTLVLGKGKSVTALANLLLAKGVPCTVFAMDDSIEPSDIYDSLISPEEARVYTGTIPESELACQLDVIVTSEMLSEQGLVAELTACGHRVRGEMELAYTYDRGHLLAITGTKGKTGSTTLLGKIIKDRTRNAFIVGEPGVYADAVCSTTKDSTTVAKIGADQLDLIERFHPRVSAIINIKRDRGDGIHFDEYAASLERIIMNQTAEDHVILNYEDDQTRIFGMRLDESPDKPRPFFFSVKRELKKGLFLRRDGIVLRDRWGERELMKTSDIRIVGDHNLENAFAAIAAAYKYGIPTDSIIRSCREYTPAAHRVEYAATKYGVKFFNDSKGTDVRTAINGIESMDCPTYLIGGGYDNGADYGEWIESFRGKVRKLVLIGQAREKMAGCAQEHGFYDYIYADNLEEAVSICTCHANPGEAVLLSPACEDRGMYKSFEERGNAFRAIVESL